MAEGPEGSTPRFAWRSKLPTKSSASDAGIRFATFGYASVLRSSARSFGETTRSKSPWAHARSTCAGAPDGDSRPETRTLTSSTARTSALRAPGPVLGFEGQSVGLRFWQASPGPNAFENVQP